MRTLLVFVIAVIVAVVVVRAVRRTHSQPRQASVVPNENHQPTAPAADPPGSPFGIPPAPLPPAKSSPAAPSAADAARLRTFDSFQKRPFAVTRTVGTNQWTTEDGRDPATIAKLAHNELEAQRLLDENPRIKRRQLVYRNETVPTLLDRARNSGQPLQSFTLPAMDGRELNVAVTETRVEPTQQFGTVTGRLKDHANSSVSVGFSNGHESFNVVLPEEGLYLIGDAREPGEVILKEFDPNIYAPPTADEHDFVLVSPSPSPQAPKN